MELKDARVERYAMSYEEMRSIVIKRNHVIKDAKKRVDELN